MSPRLSLQQQIFFFKRLSFLLRAGVPLLESLSLLNDQAARNQRTLFEKLVSEIAEGRTLSRACTNFPRAFSPFSLALVRVGEETGMLEQNLTYLAEELEQAHALRRTIIGACIYPALIACATLGIAAFLVLYLFPKITPVFVALHAQLPLPTRVVMAVSIFLQHWWLVFLIGLVAIVVGAIVLVRRSALLQAALERILLHIPVVGDMLRSYRLAQTCRTLGLLLKSGVGLADALMLTADTASQIYKVQFQALARMVERGELMSRYLAQRPRFFAPMFAQVVAVGERSGTLQETLLYVAHTYDRDVKEFSKTLSTLIEPLLMIVMGFVVGFIALAIITPIYGITQSIHP